MKTFSKVLALVMIILVSVLGVVLTWLAITGQKILPIPVYLVLLFAIPISWCCYLHDSKK